MDLRKIDEGASSIVSISDELQDVVIKTAKRRVPRGSLCIQQQYQLQTWATRETQDYKVLHVPAAFTLLNHKSYTMHRIDTTQPLWLSSECPPRLGPPGLVEELNRLVSAAANTCNAVPHDYELYLQPDGTVAMIDFDKWRLKN